MRNLNAVWRIHPALPVMISAIGLVLALCYAIFSAGIYGVFSPDVDSLPDKQELHEAEFIDELLFGKPWLAFAVGVTVGREPSHPLVRPHRANSIVSH